jgi:LmbE family N-acetylglucosaminyl deacetylase
VTGAAVTISGLGTVLGVWAHPDDECYLMAGTALLAADAGSHVACVTATAGEAGVSSDDGRWPRARLAAIRRAELATSLAVLGIDDHTWLGLPDGGLSSLDPASGIALVCEVVERVRPDTVLTFGRDGMTGHPDHVAIGDWAERAAAEVMGDRCRVLAATKTQATVDAFADIDAEVFPSGPPCARPGELALEVPLTGAVLDRKVLALDAQPSQTASLVAWIGADRYRAWVATEAWVPRG